HRRPRIYRILEQREQSRLIACALLRRKRIDRDRLVYAFRSRAHDEHARRPEREPPGARGRTGGPPPSPAHPAPQRDETAKCSDMSSKAGLLADRLVNGDELGPVGERPLDL